ncbi:MAG: hypothetical protein GX361_01970 [Bacteroidales bacterium]|nr:hypothetical protein [Bacteroidales bacterium]
MKTEDNDFLVYDEDDAVKFILEQIPAELKEKINEDTINYVLDVVYDYYDQNGLLDEESVDETDIDEEEMLQFVVKAARKDKIDLDEDDIQLVLDSEYEYGKSVGVYTEED